jgi:hypothetical protein
MFFCFGLVRLDFLQTRKMTPITHHQGKLVVRTNCDKATPFLRSIEVSLKQLQTECQRIGRVPRTVDLGCGAGRNSLYMDSLGFQVKSYDQHADFRGAIECDLSWQAIPVLHESQSVILLQYILMFFKVERRFELAIEALRACANPGIVVVELQDVKSGKMNREQIDAFIKWFIAESDVRGFKVLKKSKGKVAVIRGNLPTECMPAH